MKKANLIVLSKEELRKVRGGLQAPEIGDFNLRSGPILTGRVGFCYCECQSEDDGNNNHAKDDA